VIIEKGSLLDPSDSAAVVGGNVMTSQRLCDVIFRAFNACAASQGCCNNLTFGRDSSEDKNGKKIPGFGYYETIGGGSGAGKTWNGLF
jgi:5-oxoprolinase (ATP-hydrolysing)